jgi:hypothetical protein
MFEVFGQYGQPVESTYSFVLAAFINLFTDASGAPTVYYERRTLRENRSLDESYQEIFE